MDHPNQPQPESENIDLSNNLMWLRGKRDGLNGLNPSSTSKEYMAGFIEGWRERFERQLREEN